MSATVRGPLIVQLGMPDASPPAEAQKPEPKAEQAPAPRRAIVARPRELTVPRSDRSVQTAPPPAPVPEPEPEPRPEPKFDMAALIQANRERRRAAEIAALRGPGPGSETGTDDAASASLDRNLRSLGQSDGTGGVFQVLRKGARTGEFGFNGWTPNRGKKWREVIEVDAGPGGDVERAIVQRMIVLIREHYSGDFNWESHRLGRVVVLNAAPENNEALEEYLMREFFGTPVVRRGP
jgi:hypothetical protein